MTRVSMPFRAEFIPHIIGTEEPVKTVTRRFTPRHVGTLLRAKVPKPGKRPGQWPGFANLIVVDCRSVRLHDIARPIPSAPAHDVSDAIANDIWMAKMANAAEIAGEGFLSLAEFIAVWNDIYDGRPEKQWDSNPAVWRIEFRRQLGKVTR
jgi:hypothetical protein